MLPSCIHREREFLSLSGVAFEVLVPPRVGVHLELVSKPSLVWLPPRVCEGDSGLPVLLLQDQKDSTQERYSRKEHGLVPAVRTASSTETYCFARSRNFGKTNHCVLYFLSCDLLLFVLISMHA